ncbi:MAG: right-handed parallel beta-helix repeat-containing protein [Acetobacteraceae bacterium]|nr:right-handed parallel beta-helix repeat-containing protein [Acetobacteraceae bacterium]
MRSRSTSVRVAPILAGLAVLTVGTARADVLTMGAGQAYTTLADAVNAASAGDTIDVLAGTYVDQVATIDKPLTIQGVGGTPVFTQTAGTELANQKGFLVIDADATISNLAFSGAAVSEGSGSNGAGIRYEAGTLVVRNSLFTGNQDGILATPSVPGTGSVTVTDSLFQGNGVASGALAGFEHALYATQLALLTVTDSTFQGTQLGHDIKSRAAETVISGNYLDDGLTGTPSYAIDLSNGGDATIAGNTIAQGPDTQNWTMIAYGAEGLAYADNALTVQGNLFSNSDPDGSIGVNNFSPVVATVACNAFSGVATPVSGPANLQDNVTGTALPCAVPEPAPAALLLVGLLGVAGARRRPWLRAVPRQGAVSRMSTPPAP